MVSIPFAILCLIHNHAHTALIARLIFCFPVDSFMHVCSMPQCTIMVWCDIEGTQTITHAALASPGQVEGKPGSSLLVAIESVYGVHGTVVLLCAMLNSMHEVFPAGNAHLVINEVGVVLC